MELWLDDVRKPPEYGDYVWAKTAEEAIDLLQEGQVTFASLDHDLGFGGSGYDVVCFMERTGIWPKDGVVVHSMNPVGRQYMQMAIDRHYGGMRR